MKSKSNGNLSVEERVRQKKGKGGERERVCVARAMLPQYTECVLFPYGSITISLIHGYGLAVSTSKIMFAKNNYQATKATPQLCFQVSALCACGRVCVFWKTTTDFVPEERGTKSTGRCCCCHIHTHSHAEGMEANCYSGRCDTAFIIGFNYNEKLSSSFSCTLCLNLCVQFQLVI